MSDILSKMGTGLWVFIVVCGIIGYCVRPSDARPATNANLPTLSYRVVSPALNCREAPHAKAPIKEELAHDELVAVREVVHGWGRVPRGSQNCWANLTFLRKLTEQEVAQVDVQAVQGPEHASRNSEPGAATESQVAQIPVTSHGSSVATSVSVNNAIALNFIVDSGASDVSIPEDVFTTLVRAGAVRREDLTGKDAYTTADGSSHTELTFTIRSLKVGGVEVHDVAASVAPSGAPLLLGQSFLSRFKTWSIDNSNQRLALQW